MDAGVIAGLTIGLVCGVAPGQFQIQDSHTKVSLRGIDTAGPGIAWASGAGGTILHTEDGGDNWQSCVVPKSAATLDFRGIQAFDAKTAVAMSSGKSSLSKIYKTVDGCKSWKLVFENPDADGFFDSIRKVTGRQIYVLGDPVQGKFAMFYSADQGDTWVIADDPGRQAGKDAGAFAASNSSLLSLAGMMLFGTSSTATEPAKVYRVRQKCPRLAAGAEPLQCAIEWVAAPVPLAAGAASRGVFSLAGRTSTDQRGAMKVLAVAVGGDYEHPEVAAGTAATSLDGGEHWLAAETLPGGYRSAVAYLSPTGRWIAVGPTGVDLSVDEGRHWTAVQPAAGDAADANKGWNAISPPFTVGVGGKIGKLREGAAARAR